jgi:hypothetical protein
VAVADAYDAMTTDRPYKRAMSHAAAIAELRRHAGTQFDPELVESFCDLYANDAPEPDPKVLAMIAGNTAHGGPAIMVPDAVPGRPVRRRRRSDEVASVAGSAGTDVDVDAAGSRTMAPDGALGLAAGEPESRPTRRRSGTSGPGTVTSLPVPGSPPAGRSETATR